METTSWMCMIGASPFAVMGFVRYNGMTAEQFIWAWMKSEIMMPKRLLFLPENLYYEAMKNAIETHEKGTPAVQKSGRNGNAGRKGVRKQGNGENRRKRQKRRMKKQESVRR